MKSIKRASIKSYFIRFLNRALKSDRYVLLSEQLDIRQLPLCGSISIQQPVIIQPDTLPRTTRRSQHSPPRPKCDGLDYTGKNLEIALHHGQQRRTSIRNSPLLNIGTEHVMEYTPTGEYTIPFETRYVYDSASSSTTRSRKTNSIRVPTINSSRTHLFTNNSVRQSRTNGNFYLSTPSPRSLNSLFRVNVTTTNES